MTTPTCPGCKAKFSHSNVLQQCTKCGLPDEVLAKGLTAVRRWQKAKGQRVAQGAALHRRKRAHGRPKGSPRRARS